MREPCSGGALSTFPDQYIRWRTFGELPQNRQRGRSGPVATRTLVQAISPSGEPHSPTSGKKGARSSPLRTVPHATMSAYQQSACGSKVRVLRVGGALTTDGPQKQQASQNDVALGAMLRGGHVMCVSEDEPRGRRSPTSRDAPLGDRERARAERRWAATVALRHGQSFVPVTGQVLDEKDPCCPWCGRELTG